MGTALACANLDEEDIEQIIWSDKIGGQINGDGTGTIQYTLVIQDFDANGFSVKPSASANSDDYFWFAVNLGGLDVSLFTIDTPTSAGVVSYDGPGFTPQFGMTVATFQDTRDVNAPAADVQSAAIAAFDDTEEWAAFLRHEWFASSAFNSDTIMLTHTYSLAAADPTAAGMTILATLDSFDAAGFNLNYSAVDASVRMAFGLAIEQGV